MRKIPLPAKPATGAMAAGALIAGAALVFHLVAPSPTAAAPENAVGIHDFSFGPTALTVAVGTKVVWTNQDDDPHTVTSEADPKLFKSPPLDTGDSFSFTFDKPGTYRYFCSLHPHMQGTVVAR